MLMKRQVLLRHSGLIKRRKMKATRNKLQAALAAILILAVAIPISLQPAGANAVATCVVTVAMDSPLSAEASAKVNISGYGTFANTATANLPQGGNVSWNLTVNGQTGPWRTFAVPAATTGTLNVVNGTDFCVMTINNTTGGTVAISGTGNVSGSVVLPKGSTVSWHLTVSGQTGPWYTKTVDCTPLDTSQASIIVNAVCNMKIKNVPAGGKVNISGTGSFDHDQTVTLPSGINISWSVTANGQTGPWITKEVDCTDLDASTALCNMNIKNVPAGGSVAISGTGSFDHDQAVTLPSGINISWSVTMNGQTGPWISKVVDCTDLDASTALCNMTINNTSGGTVAISGTGNVTGSVVLPQGSTVSWHLTVSGQTGPWYTKKVDCTALDVTQFCAMAFKNIPAGGTVAISGTGSGYTNASTVTLPTGINISWNKTVGGQTSQWYTKPVDCTPLDAVPPPVNQPPQAFDDNYNTNEDVALVTASPGVLGNDNDPDGDPLTAVKVSDPAHGVLTLNSNGSFTYSPAASYNGPDSFTYKANDGSADSNIATVKITVNPIDPPAVTTDTAGNVTTNSARLNGNLTSLGTAASCSVLFQYGISSGTYPDNTTTQLMTAKGTFYADISGLAPNTTYYYQAVATGQGTAQGGEISFITGTTPPSVTTDTAGSVATNSARLNGNLTSLGTAANCSLLFQYGKSSGAYTDTTTAQTLTAKGPFYVDISGLTPNTTYYYQAVATGQGTAQGGEISFITGTTPPSVTTDTAGNVTTNSARLNGDLTSLGTAASCSLLFKYGTSSGAYTDTTTAQTLTAKGPFYVDISSLAPNTTYYYQAVATGQGTAQGGEISFITGTTPPTVLTDDATSITYNSVTLNGTLSASGTSTTDNVSFEWGESQGGPFNGTSPNAMTTLGSFTDNLTGLDESTTYFYRALAVGHGTATGTLLSFTTPKKPAPQTTMSTMDSGVTPVFSATVLGQTSMRAMTSAGALTNPMVASSKDGNLTIELARGTKILRNGMRVLSIEATQTDSPPASDGLDVIVAYEFSPAGTVFDPAPRVTVKYDADKLPGNTLGVALARYNDSSKSWEELPAQGVASIGGPVNGSGRPFQQNRRRCKAGAAGKNNRH